MTKENIIKEILKKAKKEIIADNFRKEDLKESIEIEVGNWLDSYPNSEYDYLELVDACYEVENLK